MPFQDVVQEEVDLLYHRTLLLEIKARVDRSLEAEVKWDIVTHVQQVQLTVESWDETMEVSWVATLQQLQYQVFSVSLFGEFEHVLDHCIVVQ